MVVFVDDMEASYGRMIMCHMIADSDEELLEMVGKIGVNSKWHQNPGDPNSHFDISKSKRKLAVKNGAIEITWSKLGKIVYSRRKKAAKSRRRRYLKDV